MINTSYEDNVLTVFLSGEIDHHNAPQIREAIDECVAFRQPDRLILDFGDVTFMDSSGIGLVMGRYRVLSGTGAQIHITYMSPQIYKVMKLAGMERLVFLDKTTVKA